MDKDKRLRLIYSGNVQGVGFRFTVERIANRLGIKGFVRNLPNGTVEISCEGTDLRLKGFMEEITEQMSGYIRDLDIREEVPMHSFLGFDIRF
ncbi:MAG: acylphosphatase [Candidatus Omnitrophota bacterium]